MRTTLCIVAAALALASVGHAQQQESRPHVLESGKARVVDGIKILKVRDNIHVLMGAGGNITVLAFPEGVTLVDTGLATMTDKVVAALRTITDQPVTYIINTHVHADHVGGNEKLVKAGRQITGGNVVGSAPNIAESAEIIAHENVVERMSAASVQPPYPLSAVPNTTYHTDILKLSAFYHGDGIELIHPAAAHTDGDSIVWFRRHDVIVTGDIFNTPNYPRIDIERGGSINGVIDALNNILDIAFPEFRLENGTLIVPGHGRLSDSADVAYYRDMVTIIRDRVQDMIKRGMTAEQVKAARPTRDYDGIYAATAGNYLPDQFVDAVYASLVKTVKPAGSTAVKPVVPNASRPAAQPAPPAVKK
jgi:cyclase